MKKFIVISIVLLMLAGFAITSSAEDLVVGRKHNLVGTLTVAVVGENLVITYAMYPVDPMVPDEEGWELLETHLYVGTEPPAKSAPGQFPYGPEDAEDGVYTIPLDKLPDPDLAGNIVIAAQAEIGKIYGDGEPVLDDPDPEIGEQIEETAWAEGDPIRPGKNWAMYFEFEL